MFCTSGQYFTVWKIILKVVPETIRTFEFTMVLLTADNLSLR